MALAQAGGWPGRWGGAFLRQLVLLPRARQSGFIRADCRPPLGFRRPGWGGGGQAARRRTSQTVTAMNSTESTSSQPPSINWKGQNRLPG